MIISESDSVLDEVGEIFSTAGVSSYRVMIGRYSVIYDDIIFNLYFFIKYSNQ